MTKKPRKKSQKQLLIEALLDLKNPQKINWPMEMRMLGTILEKIPDVDFWFHHGATNKYATLMHLLGYLNNTSSIHKAFFEYTKNKKLQLPTPETHELQSNKVGEDIIVPQKPKTLLEFINS
jgi:hypothetical protein